jgi:hypothetical protein
MHHGPQLCGKVNIIDDDDHTIGEEFKSSSMVCAIRLLYE